MNGTHLAVPNTRLHTLRPLISGHLTNQDTLINRTSLVVPALHNHHRNQDTFICLTVLNILLVYTSQPLKSGHLHKQDTSDCPKHLVRQFNPEIRTLSSVPRVSRQRFAHCTYYIHRPLLLHKTDLSNYLYTHHDSSLLECYLIFPSMQFPSSDQIPGTYVYNYTGESLQSRHPWDRTLLVRCPDLRGGNVHGQGAWASQMCPVY